MSVAKLIIASVSPADHLHPVVAENLHTKDGWGPACTVSDMHGSTFNLINASASMHSVLDIITYLYYRSSIAVPSMTSAGSADFVLHTAGV